MDFPGALNTLTQAASSPYIQKGITEDERQNLYRACEKLSACLETPMDRLLRTSMDVSSPKCLN
jgi:hypothetical protein